MLGYRVSYRAVMIGDEKVEKEQLTYNFTVRKATLQAVIEGLESYVLYQINVSGFTRRGDGPSGITGGGIVAKVGKKDKLQSSQNLIQLVRIINYKYKEDGLHYCTYLQIMLR